MPWNTRLIQPAPTGQYYVQVFDSLSVAGGTYPVELAYPNTCNAIDQAILASFSGAGITYLQTAGAISGTPFVNSFSLTLPQNTHAGSMLALAISFTAGTYVAGGVSVTDSDGGVWHKITAGVPPFQADFLQLWILPSTIGTAPTITVTYDGTYQIGSVTMAVTEYNGVNSIIIESDYEAGPVFGTGTPIDLTITVPTPSLLYLATSATLPCAAFPPTGGATVTNGPPTYSPGGGELPVPPFFSPPLRPVIFQPINERTIPVYSLQFLMSKCEELNPCRKVYPIL